MDSFERKIEEMKKVGTVKALVIKAAVWKLHAYLSSVKGRDKGTSILKVGENIKDVTAGPSLAAE